MAVLSGARLSSEAAKTSVNPAPISSWFLCPRPPLLGYYSSDLQGSGRGLQKNGQRAFPLVMGGRWWLDLKREQHGWQFAVYFDQFWSHFRYSMDFSGTRTLVMVTEHEGLSALVIFLGIFSGMAVFFDEFCNEIRGWMFKQLNFQVCGAVEERWWIYKLER